jgi:N6-adenosine-specific RNA methylase IME4
MKYDVILADPPWHFRNFSADEPGKIHNRGRGAASHYPAMVTEDICKLNIPSADNSVLFLWACWPTLPDALQVIDAWGFEYKSLAWVWIKANKSGIGFFTGMGYYTRANSEPCLLATRGKLPKPANRAIQALIYSSVREHSQKPDDQYRKIESLYPGKRYLEMFARRKRQGWACWGNEIENDVDLVLNGRPVGVENETRNTQILTGGGK